MDIDLNVLMDLLEHFINIRDPYENHHGQNTANYAKKLALRFGMSSEDVGNIYIAGRLHDVGKLMIPESILNKPARLTQQEWRMIKGHPEQAVEMLSIIKMPEEIIEIILQHHENLDGSGYPGKLVAKQICKGAKVIRICDSFESMTTQRAYKPRYGKYEVLERMRKYVGVFYDPILFAEFFDMVKGDNFQDWSNDGNDIR